MLEHKENNKKEEKKKVGLHGIIDFITLFTGVLYGELDHRLTLREALGKALKKPVPAHVNYLYCFGGIAFLLFVNQIITGVLLAFYYKPSPAEAYASVQYIMNNVKFGWLIRQMHAWGSHLMILMVILHMTRVFFHGAYKEPRDINWIAGTFLFFLTITFGFTGYLLPWDQLSYWATTVGTEIAGGVPVIGKYLLYFIRAGEDVSGATLTRFYTIHVIILPWITAGFLALHFLMIRRIGISEPL